MSIEGITMVRVRSLDSDCYRHEPERINHVRDDEQVYSLYLDGGAETIPKSYPSPSHHHGLPFSIEFVPLTLDSLSIRPCLSDLPSFRTPPLKLPLANG